jgi:hypothetical protein
MTLFPDLRAELVDAMERGPRRRRPPAPLLAGVPVALALALVVVLLARPGTGGELRPQPRVGQAGDRVADLPQPIRQLLTSPTGHLRTGSPLSVVELTDAGALRWTAVAFIDDRQAIAHTAAPDGLAAQALSVHGSGGFSLAGGQLTGRPVTQVNVDLARASGADHYLVSGTVDARITDLGVELGGEYAAAEISPVVLTLPIPRDLPGLTADGRRQRARMPDSTSVRAFAATFTPDRLKGRRTAQPTFQIELVGNLRTHQTGPRFCVDPKCGAIYPRAGA